MPTTNPRIHVVLEKPLYKAVERMAKKDGISLSLKVRDLIKEAIQNYQDLMLFGLARAQAKNYNKSLVKKLGSLKGEAGKFYITPSEAKAHLNKLINK